MDKLPKPKNIKTIKKEATRVTSVRIHPQLRQLTKVAVANPEINESWSEFIAISIKERLISLGY